VGIFAFRSLKRKQCSIGFQPVWLPTKTILSPHKTPDHSRD
jgi:hypothetical protein